MRRSSLVARLITGPLAFLVAGTIDVALLWSRWAFARLRARVAGRHIHERRSR